MIKIHNLYSEIDELSSKILAAIAAENFEESANYLDLRLSLLKQLSAELNVFEKDSLEYRDYLSFLKKIQQIDDSQQVHLSSLRQQLLKKKATLKQGNVAVSAYKSVARKS